MKALLLAGAALLALSFPAFAQDACAYTFDDVVQNSLAANGHPVALVPEAEIPGLLVEVAGVTGQTYEGITRAFVTEVDGTILLGLEAGGCLLPPIVLMAAPGPSA